MNSSSFVANGATHHQHGPHGPHFADSQTLLDRALNSPVARQEVLHRLLGETACRQLGIVALPAGFKLSVVIPVHNEVDNIKPLVEKLSSVLQNYNPSYEIIFVDDGSTDNTFDAIKSLHDIDKRTNTLIVKATHDKMKAAHQTLHDAVKANDPAAIDLAAGSIGNLTAQLVSSQAKAHAAFFQLLTPDQQAKMVKMHGDHAGGPMIMMRMEGPHHE